jgi:hypothetical protein
MEKMESWECFPLLHGPRGCHSQLFVLGILLQRLLRFDLECSGDRAALKAPAAKQNGYSLSSACITAAGFMFEVGCIFLSPVVFVFS